ncbi:MAG TPA: alpha/beta fold hydrolase [Candidatus Methylacidiphilales bacterium]|nr:alpha/beta fold hydrolase [Candidatus Methylacidiphilales bacterium]
MTTTCTRHEWQAPDGETFSYSLWNLPAGENPRAVVIAIHGLSGAALDFEPLGRPLTGHGVVTIALELRGQGNDPRRERRGDLVQTGDWFRDLAAFFSLVRSRWSGAQIYVYGESMGAALSIRFLAQAAEIDQPAGLVLASPVVVMPSKPGWWREQVFRFLHWARPTHRINVRKFTKPKKNEPPKLVTRDEAHRRWFETASHKLDCFTIRFFKNLHDLIDGCLADAPKIRAPVLVIYAEHDIFIPPKLVEKFFARLGSREKELRFFPEAYHLLLHDHDKAEVLDRIEAWLLRRIEVTARRQTAEARFAI